MDQFKSTTLNFDGIRLFNSVFYFKLEIAYNVEITWQFLCWIPTTILIMSQLELNLTVILFESIPY